MDDRSWMYRRIMNGRLCPKYIAGVRRFIDFAFSIDKNISEGKIRCPCVRCKNQKFLKEDDVCKHLLTKGFLPYYENWTVHGEPHVTESMLAGPLSVGISRVVNDICLENPSRNIMDCDDKCHVWINKDDSNQMIKDVWSTPEFKKRSKFARRNQLKETDGKISTHFGGTVSFASYRASMQEQADGKESQWDDVFSALHRNTKKSDTFMDNKSKKIVKNYKKKMISKCGTNQENHTSFDEAAWCVASKGVTKNRVYGASGMPKYIVSTSSSSQSYSVESAYPSLSYQALQEKLKEKDDDIINLTQEIGSLKQEMSLIKEFLSTIGFQGWTSNMSQGIPAHVALLIPANDTSTMPPHVAPLMPPHMGHTSPLVYRLRPKLSYHSPSHASPQDPGSFPPVAP